MATGLLRVTETVNGGQNYATCVYEDVADFEEATMTLHEWLWLTHSQESAAKVIMTWMRGEQYADHSVHMISYVSGTVGHWFDILYRA